MLRSSCFVPLNHSKNGFDQLFDVVGLDVTHCRPCFVSEGEIKARCSEQQGFGLGFGFGFVGVVFFLGCGGAALVKELVMNPSINALSCVLPLFDFFYTTTCDRMK